MNKESMRRHITADWHFLLQNRSFMRLLAARFISILGDSIHTVTNMWLVQQLTNSALSMGMVFIAYTVPRLIFSLIGGVSVDRYNRKWLLITSDVIRALGVLVLTGLTLAQTVHVWHIALFAAVNGTAGAFFAPAVSAIIPGITSSSGLQRANATMSFTTKIGSILGAALGGIVISQTTVWAGYLIDAVSYSISALIIVYMTIPTPPGSHQHLIKGLAGVPKDMLEGLQYLFDRQALWHVTLLSVAVTLVAVPVAQLLPSFAENTMKAANAQQIGFLWSGMTLGLLIGSVLLTVKKANNEVLWIVVAAFLFGLGTIGLGFSTGFATALGSILLMGCSLSVSSIISMTLYQSLVDENMLGRFFGTIGMLSLGLQPLMMWLAGYLADKYRANVVFTGMGLTLVGLVLLWLPQYERISYAAQRSKAELSNPDMPAG